VVERDKQAAGPHAWAGQWQQRPAARAGNLFKRHWFEGHIIRAVPNDVERWVRHWDLAATRKTRNTASSEPARTAGVKIGRRLDGRFVVADCKAEMEEGAAIRRVIKVTAQTDGKQVEISLPQDPGQAGKVQAQDYVKLLAGYIVHAKPETGDKWSRAEPFAAQCEAGNVDLVEGEWNEEYIDELCGFPSGRFKDKVDASSGAFGKLTEDDGSTYTLANIR